MGDLSSKDVSHDVRGFYIWELAYDGIPSPELVSGFDKHGYGLTKLEIEYAFINGRSGMRLIGCPHHDLRQEWISQEHKTHGSILNHAFICERKGYDNSARLQLATWGKTHPVMNQLLMIKPRWGFSFSMDWIGSDGDLFEILDYEFVGTDIDETIDMMAACEETFLGMDWDNVALQLSKKMDRWQDLDTSEQVRWKCDYLGIKQPGIRKNVWS